MADKVSEAQKAEVDEAEAEAWREAYGWLGFIDKSALFAPKDPTPYVEKPMEKPRPLTEEEKWREAYGWLGLFER